MTAAPAKKSLLNSRSKFAKVERAIASLAVELSAISC
jgi:hypothetical protein